ncbi:hypothetical protein [Bacillus massilinigeriensis]|uniref:hypothetical protein n=1 Tax=Bacillus mediterraneensis TaxID=1805474 RepID=UPI0008F7F76D|nr:hypothetical protein [Bacillus mediterraneensis]
MKKPYFLTVILAFTLALGAVEFSVFEGWKYSLYSLMEALILVPIGMLVISLAVGGIGQFAKK